MNAVELRGCVRSMLDRLRCQSIEISRQLGLSDSEQMFFKPAVDLRYGDYVSTGAFHLSRRQGISPEQAGHQILHLFSEELRSHLSLGSGYLNFVIPDSEIRSNSSYCGDHGWQSTSIALPPPVPGASHGEYMRVISSGLLQLLCARAVGATPAVYIPDELAVRPDADIAQLMRGFMRLIDRPPISKNQIEVWRHRLLTTTELVAVWANPAISRAINLVPHQLPTNVQPLYPQGSRAPSVHVAGLLPLSWGDYEVLAMVIYLSKSYSVEEFDIEIPSLKTGDNLLWFVESLCQRAARMLGESVEFSVNRGEYENAGVRAAVVRMIQIEDLIQGAGRRGDVADLLTVVGEVARNFAVRLNRIATGGSLSRCSEQERIGGMCEYAVVKRFYSLCGSPVSIDAV